MSDYILHNIDFKVTNTLDLYQQQEKDKPSQQFPNYYLGKYLGRTGNELPLKRTRRGEGEEHIPNCVLRNEDGIALIRVHNKENLTIYDLPQHAGPEVKDCVGIPKPSYPYCYVVVDYRDGKCQVAIEKTSAWDSKTTTVRNSLEKYFNSNDLQFLGIETILKEKTIATKFEEYIDDRIINCGDVIESFTFEYPNLKRHPTVRIPPQLTDQMEMYSKILEVYDAMSATTTMKMGSVVNTDKLKQLSLVVGMCSDNAFNLGIHFRDGGDYTCNEDIVAQRPMNDLVISHYKNYITPDMINIDFDLASWLDDVFLKVKQRKDDENIPTKPM